MHTKILVTGGGSSGHISPALAIIKTLQDMAASDASIGTLEFLYLGGKRGLEQKLVEAVDIPFAGVETGKLRRYLSVQNVTDMGRVPWGIGQSLGIVRRFHPDVVLSTGGYVAVPPVMAAWLLRVPVLIHEQTVQIGLANRITSRFAQRIALSFQGAMSELPTSLQRKAFVAGNPVRPAIFDGDKAAAIGWAGFNAADDIPTLYVTGGSQGARILNRTVEAVLPKLLEQCRVIHQCGSQPAGDEQDYDRLDRAAGELSPQLRRRYHFARFIAEEIKDVFALADLVLGRSGAGTVAELCALGVPALYVPLVPTGGDEQTRNARFCKQAGAAEIISQSELNGERLLREVRALLDDAPRRGAMREAALSIARPHAARDMAEAVLVLARNTTEQSHKK